MKGPYQVAHEGKVYTEGDVIDAPEGEVAGWVAAGYVEEAKDAPAKAQPKAANKAQGVAANKASDSKSSK